MITSRATQLGKGTARGRTTLIVAITISVWLVVSIIPVACTEASTPTIHAVGSAEQVYVTGLASSAQASLIASQRQEARYAESGFARWPLVSQRVRPGAGTGCA